jgi:hypothetical protein
MDNSGNVYQSSWFSSGGGGSTLSRPAGQIVRGTGTSVYSDTAFIIDTSKHYVGINIQAPSGLLDIYPAPFPGTVSATNGNATLTGSGTRFDQNFNTHDTIVIAGVNYGITQINSATSITLTTTYAGTTASGLSYSNPSTARGVWQLRENGNIYAYGATLLVNSSASTNFTNSNQANFGFGKNALSAITTGYANTAFGRLTLSAMTTGAQNTALGIEAMKSSVGANNNTAIGYQTLQNLTSGGSNTAIGTQAMSAATVTGTNNAAIGYTAGFRISSGSDNMLMGFTAGQNVSTGTKNTAAGSASLNNITTGTSNLGFGWNAGTDFGTASYSNVAIGDSAFYNNNASPPIMLKNTAVGVKAGRGNYGSGNLLLGYRATLTSATSNAANIFNTIWITGNNGVDSTTSTTSLVGINTTSPTSTLTVNGDLALSTAGNALKITEGTNGRVGQTTLVSGTKAITISGLTTNSRAFVQLVSPSGATLTVQYQAVCTANTLTIQANLGATTINTADGSTLNYFVIN